MPNTSFLNQDIEKKTYFVVLLLNLKPSKLVENKEMYQKQAGVRMQQVSESENQIPWQNCLFVKANLSFC